MVEATDFANRDDLAEFRPLNWAAMGRILVEREVSTRPVVVREIASQNAAQMPFAKDKHVIQTLAPDGADEPLREGVLPLALRRREDFSDLSFAKTSSTSVDDSRCSRDRPRNI